MQKAKTFNVDLALFITIPLGYYVGWMEWLAWINVGVYWLLMLVALIIMLTKQDELMAQYREHGITPSAPSLNPFKAGNIRAIAVLALFFVFGWNVAGWSLGAALVAFKLLANDMHRQLST